MSKLNIPLNGSNYVSDQRDQAFQDALNDSHQVDCGCEDKITVSSSPADRRIASQPQPPTDTGGQQADGKTNPVLSRALEHTFNHQARTMEIHQQYLAQQAEYIELITAVLDQQGNVLRQGNNSGAVQVVETLQRTLDNFHSLREQGIRVHQDFLHQQAAFSERYLGALENGGSPVERNGKTAPPPAPTQEKPSMEWVVQQPPIIVDEHTRSRKTAAQDPAPAKTSRQAAVQPSGEQTARISSEELGQVLLEIVAEKTGYPANMLELDMDLEADLGIDSIKRVEILGTLEERYPSLPPADTEILAQTRTLQDILDYLDSEAGPARQEASPEPEPQEISPPAQNPASPTESRSNSGSSADLSGLTEVLMEIVAEKTGYPADMLEADMDMEADLGIDSIKRVEILGAMEEQVPGLPPVETEKLAELRTLGQIVDLMSSTPAVTTTAVDEGVENKKKAQPQDLEITPVRLVNLPDPDQLLYEPDPSRPLLITGDHSQLPGRTAALLQDQGWKVVIWNFPDGIHSPDQSRPPANIPAVQQRSESVEGMNAALEEIRKAHGAPLGLIHFHSQPDDEGFSSKLEDRLIKQVFLLAGALKADLEQIPDRGRSLFMTVVESDGNLQLNGNNEFKKGSGLAGLVKTLRWEWPEVFCRFIDLEQELGPEQASRALLQEIRDPDREIVEVGIGSSGRVTIERDYQNTND